MHLFRYEEVLHGKDVECSLEEGWRSTSPREEGGETDWFQRPPVMDLFHEDEALGTKRTNQSPQYNQKLELSFQGPLTA